MITFGKALLGEVGAALRERLAALAGDGPGVPLHADGLLAAYLELCGGRYAPGPPACHLLFDVHRLVLYREPDAPGAPRVDSVVLALVDGHPFQPLDLLLEREPSEGYRFLYPVETLDILPVLWAAARPGVVVACDLVTGEITACPAELHPDSRPPRWLSAGEPAAAVAPEPLRLEDRFADAGLRPAGRIDMEGLVCRAAGVVREQQEMMDDLSLPFATARLTWDRGKHTQFCYGKSSRPAAAAFVSLCEAVERRHVVFPPPGEVPVYGSHAQLGDRAVDPLALFFPSTGGNPRQDAMHWAWAWTVADSRPTLVPAQEIWFRTSRYPGEREFFRSTTNACALGGTVEDAGLFALFEAIERDAYLTMWYLRRSLARIDPDSVDYEPFQLLRRRCAQAFPEYDFHLFDATTDVSVPTVVGVAVRRDGNGPRTFHSAAARLSAERACFSALRDLTGFKPHLSDERRAELGRLLADPRRISTPEDHFGLYALDETFDRLAFLDLGPGTGRIAAADINRGALVPVAARYNLREVLGRVAAHMEGLGTSVLLKDITHPWLTTRGLRCVKAVTPGLYPLWFGFGGQRFAVTERLRRLARDFAGCEVAEEADCNLEIHPFS